MNKKHYFGIGGFAFAMLFMGAVLFSGQPPVSRTNAPGEGNCTACHSGTLNAGPGSVTLTGPATYTPGMLYAITATVTDGTKSRFGFETTALNSSNMAFGTLAAPSANTSLQTGNVSGSTRQYVGHSNASTNNSWTFNWTAPMTASGPVTFYITGNATNNNGSTSGDNVYSNSLVIQPQPQTTAGFTASATTVCLGDAVTFTDASTGSVSSRSWDFGVGASPATANTAGPHTVTYSNIGTKTIKLVVDGTGGLDSLTQTIMVVDPPNPMITAGSSTIFCQGGSVSLDAGIFNNYSWNTGSTTRIITADTTGSYIVTVTDANGCQASDTATVISLPLPALAIMASGATTFCQGDSVILDAGMYASQVWSTGQTSQTIVADTAGTYSVTVTDSLGCMASDSVLVIVTFQLASFQGLDTAYCVASGQAVQLNGNPAGGSFGGPGLAGPTTFSPGSAGVGTHEIFYAYTGPTGCIDTARQTVNVRPRQPFPTITGYADTVLHRLCPTDSAFALSGVPAGGMFFTVRGSGLTGNVVDPMQIRSSSLQVAYVTDDGIGCSDTVQISFVVENVLDSIDVMPSATFCDGDSAILSAVGPGINYMWSTGDTTQRISVKSSGRYTVSAEARSLPGCVVSATASVTALPLPMPVITGLGPFATGNYITYQWYYADSMGNPVMLLPGETDSTFSASMYASDPDNTGAVVVVVTDRNGCEGTSQAVPVVRTLGISNILPSLSLEMYPNPVRNQLYLEFELQKPSPVEVVFLDAKGKTVFRQTERFGSGSMKTSFSVAALPSGLYLIQVKTANGYAVGKFVKE